LERDPAFAAVIMSLVDLAGLSDVVKIIVGSSDESIARLYQSGQLKHIDLMFLDHYKPAYTTDLKLCEELGLITEGSVLAADNVIKPGNPPYLEYVRSSVEQKFQKAKQSGNSNTEGIAETNVKMYEKRYGEAKFNQSPGKPTLIYESKLVNSYEPTGVPVSSHIIYKYTPDPALTFCRTVSRSLAAQESRNEQRLRQAQHMGIDKTLDYGSICVSYSHT
jgi:catechol O-methyltransferase